jgi:hypothetical protein
MQAPGVSQQASKRASKQANTQANTQANMDYPPGQLHQPACPQAPQLVPAPPSPHGSAYWPRPRHREGRDRCCCRPRALRQRTQGGPPSPDRLPALPPARAPPHHVRRRRRRTPHRCAGHAGSMPRSRGPAAVPCAPRDRPRQRGRGRCHSAPAARPASDPGSRPARRGAPQPRPWPAIALAALRQAPQAARPAAA